MASPIVIQFLAQGMPDISRAFRTIEQAAAASQRSQSTALQRGAQHRMSMADTEARAKVRAMIRADALQRSAQDASVRDRQRVLQQRGQAEERAANHAIRQVEREARARIRINDKAEAEVDRIRHRAHRAAQTNVNREVAHQKRAATQAAEASSERRQRYASALVGGVTAGASRVASIAAKTAGIVGQLGGGFNIGDSVQRTVALKGKLADMASRDVASEHGARKSTGSLEGAVRGVSTEFGLDPEKAADGLDKFASKTGKLQVGLDMLRGLSELSRAGVGDLDDLADAAGDVFNADKAQTGEQVLQKLRAFAMQGAKGSVEMKDMAAQLARVTATAGKFSGDTGEQMMTFGALAQLAKESGGAATPAEAMSSVSALGDQFGKNARIGKMKEMGVDPKTAEGFNKPIETILMDMMTGAEKASRKGGGGLKDFDVKFGSMIASTSAQKATNPLTKAFKEAGGGEAGVAAAKAQLAKFGAGGRNLKGEYAATAKERMGEDDAKMAIMTAKFDAAVSTKLIPKLLELMPVIERIIPQFVDLAATGIPAFVALIKSVADFANENKKSLDFLAAHPIGAIMAFEVTKSIGAAGLGEVFQKVLATSLGQKGGLVVGSATLAITSAMIAIEAIADKQSGQVSGDVNTTNKAWSAASGPLTGRPSTAADLNGLIDQRDSMQSKVEADRKKVNSKEGIEYVGMMGEVAKLALGPVAQLGLSGTNKDSDEAGALYQKSRDDRLKSSEEALVKLNKAIDVASANLLKLGTGNVPGPDGKPPQASTGIVQRTK